MKKIRDESELPAPDPLVSRTRQFRYLRSLCDPRAYIHGDTGEVYVRSDGLMWENPGYKVGLSKTDMVERESAAAFGDFRQFPYAKQSVAA